MLKAEYLVVSCYFHSWVCEMKYKIIVWKNTTTIGSKQWNIIMDKFEFYSEMFRRFNY